MRLLDAIRPRERLNLAEAYFDAGNPGGNPLGGFTTFSVGGQTYTVPLQTTMPGQKTEAIQNSFEGYVLGGLMGNSVIFGLTSVRIRVFSEARFQFQQIRNGRPGDLFGNQDLAILERPWPGGVTGDLLALMLLHSDFGGNCYLTKIDGQIVAMRPDWVEIMLGDRRFHSGSVGMEKLGYNYYQGGKNSGVEPVSFLAEEVAHFAPQPDPLAWYRGMSWLTPVVREIQADGAMTGHKLKFLENAAAQPLDSKVLTPTGWTTMGQVDVGTSVVGPDGLPREVEGVYPQGEKDVYRIRFAGGAETEACGDHVWTVTGPYDRRLGRTRNLTTSQLLTDGVREKCGLYKWAVPVVDPIEYESPQSLPVDPYLLGLLLGDGSFRSNGKGSGGVTLACNSHDADETQREIESLLPEAVSITRRDRGGWSELYFSGGGGPKPNPLTCAIRDLGLYDVAGLNKFIPGMYLRASIKDRVSVLQGLIDSDGCTSHSDGAAFTSTSETLSLHVAELVGSLGGFARVTRSHRGDNRPQYGVYLSQLPAWIIPCRLARKVACWDPCPRRGWRTIKSIELIRRAEVQCIRVAAEDGLYVTDDFVVTHNTPNLAVKLEIADPDAFQKFVDKMDEQHQGWQNAYKTLYTGAGADVTVIGKDMKELDFANVVGKGEPLALDTPVPTVDGWTTMAEIQPGDKVLGRNGRPANVVAVGPVHEGRQCFRVNFKDRTAIVADASHLWVATDRTTNARAEKVYTTASLYSMLQGELAKGHLAAQYGNRVAVPDSPIVELPERDLLIDPYVLGAWLGDGQTAGAAICGAADDLAFVAKEIEARGYCVTEWTDQPGKVSTIGVPGGLLHALRALGVLGDKRIPTEYLRASVGQRLDLLRGLMDTDGSIAQSNTKGGCQFSSKFEHLARQVAELVRSLGYRVTVSCKADSRSRTGSHWLVWFRSHPDRVPFLLPRKVERCLAAGATHVKTRTVTSIEPVDSVPVRCITVDTTDHLFLVGEGFIPTHNTRLAAAAGVPPTVAGLSEGLQGSSLNAGNFGQARRQFADMTLSPLWRNASGSLETLVPAPDPASRLWYDTRDIPFLREDQADAASIRQSEAAAIRELFMAGFTPDSIKAAVIGGDWTLLEHTGTYSIQVQTPGTTSTKMPSTVDEPPAAPEGTVDAAPQSPAIPAKTAQPAPPAGAGNNGGH